MNEIEKELYVENIKGVWCPITDEKMGVNIKRYKSKNRVGKPAINATDLGGCKTKLYYKLTNVEKTNEMESKTINQIFQLGNYNEDRVVIEEFIRSGIYHDHSVRIYNNELEVSGEIDALIIDSDGNIAPVEIKNVGEWSYNGFMKRFCPFCKNEGMDYNRSTKMYDCKTCKKSAYKNDIDNINVSRSERPLFEHLFQLTLYMITEKFEYGYLYYGRNANGDHTLYKVYNDGKIEKLIREYITEVKDAVKTSKRPEIIESFKCKGCEYHDVCFPPEIPVNKEESPKKRQTVLDDI